MKISVDTKEDSPEHIRKVIDLLHNVIGSNPNSGALMSSSSASDYSASGSTTENTSNNSAPATGIFNMFNDDNDNSSANENTESEDSDESQNNDDSSYTIKEEKMVPIEPEEIPQVAEYDIV